MLALSAPVTSHLRDEAWPRSIVAGSAVKNFTIGFATTFGAGASVFAAGGGAGAGTFFLHPAAKKLRQSANANALALLVVILVSASWKILLRSNY
jgi:hypothetical protein